MEKAELFSELFTSTGSQDPHFYQVPDRLVGGWVSEFSSTTRKEQVWDHLIELNSHQSMKLWHAFQGPEEAGWCCCQAPLHYIWKVMAVKWSPWWLEKWNVAPIIAKGKKGRSRDPEPRELHPCAWEDRRAGLPAHKRRGMTQGSQNGITKGKSCLANLVAFLWWQDGNR